MRIQFDSGDSHRYYPRSPHKLLNDSQRLPALEPSGAGPSTSGAAVGSAPPSGYLDEQPTSELTEGLAVGENTEHQKDRPGRSSARLLEC